MTVQTRTSAFAVTGFDLSTIVKEWSNGEDIAYAICRNELPRETWYCGYALVKGGTLQLEELRRVSVNGGVTYQQTVPGVGCIYGFDCGHQWDKGRASRSDVDGWLTDECESMGNQIAELKRTAKQVDNATRKKYTRGR